MRRDIVEKGIVPFFFFDHKVSSVRFRNHRKLQSRGDVQSFLKLVL